MAHYVTEQDLLGMAQRIEGLFIRAGEDSTNVFGPEQLLGTAFGQYLGAHRTAQRGLHGTAAALRVLAASSNPSAQTFTANIVRYLKQRHEFEMALAGTPAEADRKVRRDHGNVIKTAETLYALKFVQPALIDTNVLINEHIDRLTAAGGPDGWPYFSDQDRALPELLPTAHAVRALAVHGRDVTSQIEFLQGQLSGESGTESDVFIRTMCVFVLADLRRQQLAQIELRRVRTSFDELWRRLRPLMRDDLEANIEYASESRNYYVRVPWQLHLIATSAMLRPYTKFTSRWVQQRLDSARTALIDQRSGLVYPHSGDRVSARTNSILFDTLDIVRQSVTREGVLRPLAALNRLSRFRRLASALAGIAFIVWAFVAWRETKDASFGEVAPEVVAAALLILVTGRRG